MLGLIENKSALIRPNSPIWFYTRDTTILQIVPDQLTRDHCLWAFQTDGKARAIRLMLRAYSK